MGESQNDPLRVGPGAAGHVALAAADLFGPQQHQSRFRGRGDRHIAPEKRRGRQRARPPPDFCLTGLGARGTIPLPGERYAAGPRAWPNAPLRLCAVARDRRR
jgi:hypothetical protein